MDTDDFCDLLALYSFLKKANGKISIVLLDFTRE